MGVGAKPFYNRQSRRATADEDLPELSLEFCEGGLKFPLLAGTLALAKKFGSLESDLQYQLALARTWIRYVADHAEIAITDACIGRTKDGMIERILCFQPHLQPNPFMRVR